MKIISIDGGGYLGLASASFLAESERHFKKTVHESFDFFCGTSAGSIIALGLASGLGATDIVDRFIDLGRRVFPKPGRIRKALKSAKKYVTSKYTNEALKEVLKDTFGNKTIGDIQNTQKKHLLVPAFSVTNGTPRIFKTDHSSRLSRDSDYLLRDVALASSSAPVYFPLANIIGPDGNSELFTDGGLYANNPALLAYIEAVSELKVASSDIKILSISTPRQNLAEFNPPEGESSSRRTKRGVIQWGEKLVSVMIDSPSFTSDQILKRLSLILGFTYTRVLMQKPEHVDLDIVSDHATSTLKHLGREQAAKEETRNQLKAFF